MIDGILSAFRKIPATILAACAALILTGCASLDGMKNIPGIGYSTLTDEHAALRGNIFVTSAPLSQGAIYRPFECSYRAVARRLGAQPELVQSQVTLTRVRERLLVRVVEDGKTSTALIGPDGRLFDFNMSDFLAGERIDGRTFDELTAAEAQRLSQSQGREVRVLNEFSIVFPHFIDTRPRPGSIVAAITYGSGVKWGEYVYRGLSSFGAKRVAVLDLITRSGGVPVVQGFSLVDVETMAPVLTILDATSSFRLEQTTCAPSASSPRQ